MKIRARRTVADRSDVPRPTKAKPKWAFEISPASAQSSRTPAKSVVHEKPRTAAFVKTRRQRMSVMCRASRRGSGSFPKRTSFSRGQSKPHHIHPDNVIQPSAGDATPIKHQNGVSLRQLYGAAADARLRIDSLFVSSHLGRQSDGSAAGASKQVR